MGHKPPHRRNFFEYVAALGAMAIASCSEEKKNVVAPPEEQPLPAPPPEALPRGTLFILGGGVSSGPYKAALAQAAFPENEGKDLLTPENIDPSGMFRHTLSLCSKAPLRITVLSATSDTAEESAIYGERYAAIFKKLAPDAAVGFVGYVTPENDAAAAKQVRRANIVFMIGGDQDYLAQQYHPKTETYQSLKTKLQMDGGFVLAGTSAGAAIVSHHMISGGKPEEPQKVLERMGTGFGFLPGVIVDTHFFARHRLPRELTVIGDRYPGHLGMGLEEATGLIVRRGTLAEVVGAGKVWLISKDLNPELKEDRLYPLTEPSVAAYANKGLRVHYMEKGDVYDLARHKLLTQEQVAQRTEEINGAPALAAGGGGR